MSRPLQRMNSITRQDSVELEKPITVTYINNGKSTIEQKDLYCFEASLYKHWTEEFNSRRIFLSFGFLVPYNLLGRNSDDPRVRLSKRIENYFQKINKPDYK
jgi:hypothetical protein